MLQNLNKFIRNSFDKKIDGTGLAIFRITYTVVLLCEITQMYYFRHLIFDKIPYIEESEINIGIPILIWFISCTMILFGIFTRFASIINYLLSLILIATINSYEYHVFYAYMGLNFLLIFMPISQCFSLDRLLMKLKYSNTTFQYNPTKKVSQLYYFIPLYLIVGLAYFDSIFSKLSAHSWLHGLGVWLPSSLPMMVQFNLSYLLNFKYFVFILSTITLATETIFIFVFFRKNFRIPVFIVGTFLHIGILITFPIPWFALTFISIYLLLIPVSFWQKIFKNKNKTSSFYMFYDSECPLCVRTKISISHLDWFNKIEFKTVQFDAQKYQKLALIDQNTLLNDIHSIDKKGTVFSGIDTYIQVFRRIFYLYPLYFLLKVPPVYHYAKKIYAHIAQNRTSERCSEKNCEYNPPMVPDNTKIKLLKNYTLHDFQLDVLKKIIYSFSIVQIIIILNSPVIHNINKSIGMKSEYIDKRFNQLSAYTTFITKPLFGLTQHNVFIDAVHYEGYSHIISIVYSDKNGKETWLPIIDKNGQPSYYNYGTNWRKMSFMTNSPAINIDNLNNGIRDFTAFWAHKNNIDLSDALFLIKVKKIESTKIWEKDFLNRQILKPWNDGGYVAWRNEIFQPHIKDIESL
jgi:predicted DCC family thiol-disulfide oxidoreductase YuxK